jgi:hypothetical protein
MAITLKRFEAIEIPVPSGTTLTRFYFPDQPNLRNAKIQAIQVYTYNTLSATPLSGSNMVSAADMKKSFLTLYSGDLQLIYSAPLLSFNNESNGTDPFVYEVPKVDNMIISWTKCYVSLPTAPTGGVAYAFGVYYTLDV